MLILCLTYWGTAKKCHHFTFPPVMVWEFQFFHIFINICYFCFLKISIAPLQMILNLIINLSPPWGIFVTLHCVFSGTILSLIHYCIEGTYSLGRIDLWFPVNDYSALWPPVLCCLGMLDLECYYWLLWTVFIFAGKIYRFITRVKTVPGHIFKTSK